MNVSAPKKALENSDLAAGDHPDLNLDEIHEIIARQLARAESADSDHDVRNAAQAVLMHLEEYKVQIHDRLYEVGL